MRPGVQLARRRLATSPRPAPTTWRCGAPTSCAPSSTATCPLRVQPGKQPRPECDVRLHGDEQRPHRRDRTLPRRAHRPAHRAHPGRREGRRQPEVQFSVQLPADRRGARGALERPGRRRAARPAAADGATTRPGCSSSQAPSTSPTRRCAVARRRARHRDHRRLPRVLVDGRPHGRARRQHLTPAWTLRDTLGPPAALRQRPAGAGPRRPRRSRPRSAARRCARCPCRAPTPPPGPVAAGGRGAAGAARPRGRGAAARRVRRATRTVSTAPTSHDHARRGQRPARPGGAVRRYDLRHDRHDGRGGVHRAAWPAPGPGEPSCSATTHATTRPTTSATSPPRAPRTGRAEAPSRRARCRDRVPVVHGFAHGLSAHGSPLRCRGAALRAVPPDVAGAAAGRGPRRGTQVGVAARRQGVGRVGQLRAPSAPPPRGAPRSDASSCRQAATSPLGTWCSSTSGATAAQRALGAERVQRQRLGRAGVVGGGRRVRSCSRRRRARRPAGRSGPTRPSATIPPTWPPTPSAPARRRRRRPPARRRTRPASSRARSR